MTEYNQCLVKELLEYLVRISETEHGMDGAVREAARQAQRILDGTARFKSSRADVVEPPPVTDADKEATSALIQLLAIDAQEGTQVLWKITACARVYAEDRRKQRLHEQNRAGKLAR